MSDTPAVDSRKAAHRDSLKTHDHGGLDDLHTELDKSPVHEAARENDVDELQRIVATNGEAAIHARDKYGLTPLHWATDRGHAAVAQYLIDRGANVNAVEKRLFRRTPLHFAAVAPSVETVALLLAHGADASAIEYRGWGAIHYAAHAGAADVLQTLHQHGGCDMRLQSNIGETALHVAARTDQQASVAFFLKLLDEAEHLLGTANSDGLTPWEVAAAAGHEDAARLLEQAASAPVSARKIELSATPSTQGLLGDVIDPAVDARSAPAS